ncbi:folate-binding protein, partial [Rhizobium ruizarguesonis]
KEALYDALRISHGIVTSGSDFARQDAFPHDVLMDFNGGISFRKGCYVGQEVVSRMQHRGTARRRVVTVSAATALPETGTEIT